MRKFTMPKSADFSKYFLAKKTLYGPKKDPVWVYLEKEMQENINEKPYNEKVGDWLVFLEELKRYFHQQSKKEEKILNKEIGPPWYTEMSASQRDILQNLHHNIHHDQIGGRPERTRKALSDLGFTRRIPNNVLMNIMADAGSDTAVFIWKLYTAIYNKTPSEPRKVYDFDAIILMSSLVVIDIEECLQALKDLTKPEVATEPVKQEKKPKRCSRPKDRYSMYLEKKTIPVYCKHPSPQRGKRVKRTPPSMENKVTIRSDHSCERLRMDHSFIDRRMQRSKKANQTERVCNYNFWEPPISLLNNNPKQAAAGLKLKMLRKSAKVRHSSANKNSQMLVGPVVLVGKEPLYLLNSMCILPTGYITIQGGTTKHTTGEYLTIVAGAWKYPVEGKHACDSRCQCLKKWEPTVMNHLKNTKCTCEHKFDFHNEGKATEKYFYPPTTHSPMWFDNAKIFQMDPVEDVIREAARLAEMSQDPTPEPSHPGISVSGLNLKVLLKAFLADLSNTSLMIPHLPEAYRLNNLLEWMRRRFRGELTPSEHKQANLQSLRRWLWLKHMDFRKRAYFIPFTKEELESMTWHHRRNLQKLFETLLADFTQRNRLSQLGQTRLWWSTMKYDRYPNEKFLDVFFTYMPGRMQDTYILNPYCADRTPTHKFKYCPGYSHK